MPRAKRACTVAIASATRQVNGRSRRQPRCRPRRRKGRRRITCLADEATRPLTIAADISWVRCWSRVRTPHGLGIGSGHAHSSTRLPRRSTAARSPRDEARRVPALDRAVRRTPSRARVARRRRPRAYPYRRSGKPTARVRDGRPRDPGAQLGRRRSTAAARAARDARHCQVDARPRSRVRRGVELG